jgi:hypothetical protein
VSKISQLCHVKWISCNHATVWPLVKNEGGGLKLYRVAAYILDWLVGSLFNDAFSVTRLYSIDDRIVSEWWWIGKDLAESGRGLILMYYHSICREGLRKTMKPSIRVAGHWGWESNLGTPNYEAGVLNTQPQHLVHIL